MIEVLLINSDSSGRLQSWREKNAEARFQLQSALDYKRFQENWGDIASKARTVAIVTPLNDVLDLCETITGRETCLESGRVLSKNERLFAAAGVILGSRVVWKGISDKIKLSLFDDFRPIKLSEEYGKTLIKSIDNVVVHDASVINKQLLELGYTEAPYKVGTRVYEFKTNSEIKDVFVRIYGGKSKMSGRWIIPRRQIEGLTPSQIKDKLGLSYLPEFISEATLPAGVTLRKGVVNPIFETSGERFTIQYEILTEVLSPSEVLNIFKPIGKIK